MACPLVAKKMYFTNPNESKILYAFNDFKPKGTEKYCLTMNQIGKSRPGFCISIRAI